MAYFRVGNTASGGGTGTGATITVTYSSDFYGETLTATNGNKTVTVVAPSTGTVDIEVPEGGTWTISATIGGYTYSTSVVVNLAYSTTITTFNATVTVTFPYALGATCTLSDGVTTLTATQSPMAFSVGRSGTWTATVTLEGISKTDSAVITTDGQSEALTIEYGTINLTYANEFRGLTITCTDGDTTITKTAPSGSNAMVFYPPSTGTWAISGTYNGTVYSTNATISSLSTAVSANLQTTITLSVTLYSATEDTVSYTDINGNTQTEVFSSGESSKVVSIEIMPSGSSITFTSSVAKNPSDLTAYYSKNVNLTNNTTEVYVMPDGAIYWYGNECSLLTGGLDYTGYALQGSGPQSSTPFTKNTNDLSGSVTLSNSVNVDTTNTISMDNYTKANAIYNTGSDTLASGNISLTGSKYLAAYVWGNGSANWFKLVQGTAKVQIRGTGGDMINNQINYTGTLKISALWLE